MIPYVYLIRWTNQDVSYIGVRHAANCHPSDLWKTYFTSSKYVTEFRQLHGEPDHIEILKEFIDPNEAIEYEAQKLKEFDVLNNDNWLNRCIHGKYFGVIAPRSEETRKRISESWKTRPPVSAETRLKMSIARKGKKHSEETKAKMRGENNSFYGKTHSEATRKKLSEISIKRKGVKRGKYKKLSREEKIVGRPIS